MTPHALIVNLAARVGLTGIVIARIHGPVAALFRVPRQRKFLQRARLRAVQVSAHMVPRTHDKVDGLLFHIGFLAIESSLVAALVIVTIPLDHLEVRLRSGVIILTGAGGTRHGIKRTGHGGLLVRLVNLRVASGADPGILRNGGGCERDNDQR